MAGEIIFMDLITGDSLVRGFGYDTVDATVVDDDARASATRPAIVEGLVNTTSRLSAAITAVKEDATGLNNVGFHPSNSKLIVTSMGATTLAPTKAQVDVHYEPLRIRKYDSSITFHPRKTYKDEAGALLPEITVNGEVTRQHRIVQRAVRTIRFTHQYRHWAAGSTPPLYDAFAGKMNSASYSLVDFGSYGAKSLLYLGASVNAIVSGNTTVWELSYTLLTLPNGTWEEEYVNNTVTPSTVAMRDEYPATSFTTLVLPADYPGP